jgi:hypothetical protein
MTNTPGSVRSLLFCITLSIIIFQGFNANAQVIRFEHKANRLEGFTNIVMEEGMLFFESAGRREGFIVIESDAPLIMESTPHVEAELSPGWDGTLGYKLYGIRLNIGKPTTGEVRLQIIEPPDHPIPTTLKEIERFEDQLESRSSKFPDRASNFQNWQRHYRDSLAVKLMGGGLPGTVPPDVIIEYEIDYENFRLYLFSYQSMEDRHNKALLSIPKNIEKVPLLVALHGHETSWGMADSAAYRMGHIDDFCAYFANRGWAVLQPATMDHQLQHQDWTLQGEWTWDAMAAIDICSSYPSIQMDQIAVCGLSTGGHLAMNLLALDLRIKAGVVGCVLSTWNHYEKRFRIPLHCDCGIHQQLSPLMEQCDWAALASPKPVQFQHGLQDPSFCPGADVELLDLKWNTGIMPLAEYDAMFGEISRAYGIYETKGNVSTIYHDGPHSINNEKAFDWLMNVLHLKSQ